MRSVLAPRPRRGGASGRERNRRFAGRPPGAVGARAADARDSSQQVRNALGTTTLRETVDEAFRAVLRERARREEVEALSTMRGMDLDDAGVMAAAWRP